MKLANLSKILKCANNDDAITMKSEDNGDTITFIFESQSAWGRGVPALAVWDFPVSNAAHGWQLPALHTLPCALARLVLGYYCTTMHGMRLGPAVCRDSTIPLGQQAAGPPPPLAALPLNTLPPTRPLHTPQTRSGCPSST